MTHEDALTTLATERYFLDEMTAEERDAFEAHFFDCQICAGDVRAAAALREGVQAGAANEGRRGVVVPIHASKRRPAWTQTILPLAAAAALAVVAGYQAIITIPSLRSELSPRAVTPVVLTPASRSEGTAVEVPAGRAVVLSVDVNIDPMPRELVYDVRTVAGAVVFSGRTSPPLSGTPLLLWLPGSVVTTGEYVLTLGSADADGPTGTTYRLTVR